MGLRSPIAYSSQGSQATAVGTIPTRWPPVVCLNAGFVELKLSPPHPPPPGFDKAGGTPWSLLQPPATGPLQLQVPSMELGKTLPAAVTKHLLRDRSELCTSSRICRIEALVHCVQIPEQYKTPLSLEPTALHKNAGDSTGAKPLLIAVKNWLINLLPLMK